MTLRTLLGIAPTTPTTRPPLAVLPPAAFDLHDPCTFPCAFLSIPETDLRSDR